MTSLGAAFDKTNRYSSNSSRESACPAEGDCARPVAPKITSRTHVNMHGLISAAANSGTEANVYRPLNVAMLLCMLLLLFEPILASKTIEDDLRGLLPPISVDHSTTVAYIRRALR